MDDRILGQKNRTGACLDKTLASSLTTALSDCLPVTGSWYEYIANKSKSGYVTCTGNCCYLGTTSPHHDKQKTREGKLKHYLTGEKLPRMTFNKIPSSWESKSAVCQTICMEMNTTSCGRNIRKKIFPVMKVSAVTS